MSEEFQFYGFCSSGVKKPKRLTRAAKRAVYSLIFIAVCAFCLYEVRLLRAVHTLQYTCSILLQTNDRIHARLLELEKKERTGWQHPM